MSSVPPPEGIDLDALQRQLTPGAEAGEPDAMMRLCAVYLAKQDWEVAEFWARRLIGERAVIGMRFLAGIREQRGDEAGAREWNRRAQEAESRTPAGRSMARLTAAIVERFGEDPDPEQLRAAAQVGDTVAMTALGMLLIAEGDLPQAVPWLTPAAEAGDPLAMYGLGVTLSVQGDDEAAGRWLESAATSGESMLMEAFADFAERTGDEERARYWKTRVREAAAAEEDEAGPGACDDY